jgi:hypothetical protein
MFSLLTDGIIMSVRFSLSRGGINCPFGSVCLGVVLLCHFVSVSLGVVLLCPFGSVC